MPDSKREPVREGSYPHLNDSARIKLMILVARTVGWLEAWA